MARRRDDAAFLPTLDRCNGGIELGRHRTDAAEPFDAHPGLRVIRGAKFTPRVWVTVATAYFVAGHARVLVGTRALLGEGWDCAALNVTIDLTSATTPVAITQMPF